MKGLRIMDLLSTFLYFMPMLTVILLGAVLFGLAYNLYLDRKTFAYASSGRASGGPNTLSS
jgi:hypothetical protein